jgi:hypothetical protein
MLLHRHSAILTGTIATADDGDRGAGGTRLVGPCRLYRLIGHSNGSGCGDARGERKGTEQKGQRA